MFEDGHPGCDAPVLDEPELTEAEWQALVAYQISVDPQPWPDPTAEEIAGLAAEAIAVGESAPVSVAVIAGVWDLDPQLLGRDDRIGLSVALDRIINAAEARKAQAIAATVAVTPPAQEWLPAEAVAAADLGAALGLGSGGAGTVVCYAVAVCARLADTLALARSGDLTWRKATVLADAVAALTDEQALAVETTVLPRAVRRTPAQHAAAVRRAVDKIDPDGAAERRRQMRADIRLVRTHTGSGMAELWARMTSEACETVWAGADHWARRQLAAGDPRPLDELRVAALVAWSQSFLTHGDASYCDTHCTPTNDSPVKETDEPAPNAPVRHGRPGRVAVERDLTSLLGLTFHGGRLTSSDATLPPEAVRDLLAGGAYIRRLLIDPATGQLLDLTPRTWVLPPTNGCTHPQPIELRLSINGPAGAATDDTMLRDYSVREGLPQHVRDALATAPVEFTGILDEVIDAPITALTLDTTPDAAVPSAALAAFTTTRDGHPVNPTAGLSDAAAGDIDHHTPRNQGGQTTRANTASFTRRWHLLKTHADWTVQRTGRTWTWTSPTGRTYTTEPHDYRLGP